ncbi:unnamed protein product [Ilex paraguariensis]|uniref:Uncharacterized protein n=1 Tax=Ilex paraguariensis TaxID=185542 RepID=A0ABC8SU78_9AQUA
MLKVWIDAMISSVERKPHEVECACQFYVNFYLTEGPASMTKKTLKKDINIVQIDQISIIQKLQRKPCEDKHYRWSFSEDCPAWQTYRLVMGRFASDLTWLLVASVLKQIVFDVRSIKNQIVYHIWDGYDKSPPNSMIPLIAINFRLENENLTPILIKFVPVHTLVEGPAGETCEDGSLSFYDLMDLRRSKRRHVQPERYLGCDSPYLDVDMARIGIHKTYKREYEDSIQDDHACPSEKHVKGGNRVNFYKRSLLENFLVFQSKLKSKGEVSSVVSQGEHTSVATKQGEHHSQLPKVPLRQPVEESDLSVHKHPLDAEIPEDHSGEIGKIVSNCIYRNHSPAVHGKEPSEDNFMVVDDIRERENSNKICCTKRKNSTFSERKNIYDVGNFTKGNLSSNVYREMIRRCMKNIDSSMKKEQPLVIDQWKEFQATNSNQRDCTEELSVTTEDESSEIEMLWKEMELVMASTYFHEESEGSHVEGPAEAQISSKESWRVCRHEYKLNEEIGVLCKFCGFVSTEIKDVQPSFLPRMRWDRYKERRTEDDSEHKPNDDGGLDGYSNPVSSNTPFLEGEDNVWALIPDLKGKLHFHQKRAFEFLWRNIAGSLEPAHMKPESKRRGGCVISHSPGAGKTFLIITFLVSYLKLFPRSRPLVIAPKTALYTWHKEIIKWEIPVPVYQIHGNQTFRGEVSRQKLKLLPGIPRNLNVMHSLDCLEKLRKWLDHPSVLLMGYSSFLTLTREDSKYAHKKYMAQVLRQSPGILILDEGHNPRSTKSRLRKGLMKVNTGLRVLLSGTLFQNNFGEYFNTLCLARPSFVNEVLKGLDLKFKTRKRGAKTFFSLENRARKFFIDKIAKKIDSNVAEERLQGLNLLKNMTSGFIDVHEGSHSDKLPGLQCYTLMMKLTAFQQGILEKLQNQKRVYKGFPLELELLITLGAIHPWLIKTTANAIQHFSTEELEALETSKFDLKIGSKVRFVMSLVPLCFLRKEKILIFCHNIAPINLFLEIFQRFYGWRKGEEVLVLQGELELFERGRVMDKFEEPGGVSKVMLASITASAEGISLTAASRVILLDSEWNPSKTKQAIARAFRPGQDKVVYVYQLLATGTLEEEKYGKTMWKEWVSSMMFSEALVEDPSHWQAQKIEDELLREIVEEDRATLFHKIMKNEKASNWVDKR